MAAAMACKRHGAIVIGETGQGHYMDYKTLYQEALAQLKKREELAGRLEQLISDLDLRRFPQREELFRILKELRGG